MQELKEKLIEINVILEKSGKLNPRFKYVLFKKPEYLQYIVEATSFLKYDAPIKARLQCIVQDIKEQPVCKRCNEPCKMTLKGSKYNNKFSAYCGRKCAGLDSRNINQVSDHQV